MKDQRNQPGSEHADIRPKLARVVLTGFMGAGKSTVGAVLAQSLGWRFLDLDSVIEDATGLSVAQIFRDHGEAHFRGREREAVQQLSYEDQIVLALGGGTMEDEASRSLLLDTPGTCVIFLEGRLDDLMARCRSEDKVRPLLNAPEVMEARLAHRLPFYRLAHATVETTGLTPEQVADQVLDLVSVRWQWAQRKKVVQHGHS